MIYKIQGNTLFQVDNKGNSSEIKKIEPNSNIILNLRETFKDDKDLREKIIQEKDNNLENDKPEKKDKPIRKTRTKKNGV